MQQLDLFFLGFILIFSIKGVFKGGIKEMVSLSILFLSIIIAPIFAEQTGSYLDTVLHLKFQKDSFYFFGYFILIILFLFVGGIVNLFLGFFVKMAGLSLFNRISGIIVGGFKGIIILIILLTIFSNIDMTKVYIDKHSKNSLYYSKLINIGKKLMYNVNSIKEKTIKNKTVIENEAKKISETILKQKEVREFINKK